MNAIIKLFESLLMKRRILCVFLLSFTLQSALFTVTAEAAMNMRIQFGHSDKITSIAYSPDGRFILTSDAGTGLILWDTKLGKEVRNYNSELKSAFKDLPYNTMITGMAFSPDGKYFAAALYAFGKDGGVALFNFSSGSVIKIIPATITGPVIFSPDSRFLLYSECQSLKVMEVPSLREIKSMKFDCGCINDIAVSPDGKQILFGASRNGEVKLLDFVTLNVINSLKEGDSGAHVRFVHFKPDGKRAVIISGYKLFTWNFSTGQKIVLIKSGYDMDAALSPDGKYLLVQEENGILNLWNPAKGKKIRDIRSMNSHRTANIGGTVVAISHDSRYGVYKMGRYFEQIELSTGKEVKTFSGRTAEVKSAVFSPDGKKVLTATNFWTNKDDHILVRTLVLWDLEMKESPRVLLDSSYAIDNASFSPDGKEVIAFSDLKNYVIHVDATDGRILHRWEYRKVKFALFSPDGKYIIMEKMGINTSIYVPELEIYDRITGEIVKSIKHKEKGRFQSLVFSPDGSLMAIPSVHMLDYGKTSYTLIWKYPEFEEVKTIAENIGHGTVFSSDGKSIISLKAGDQPGLQMNGIDGSRDFRSFKGGKLDLRAMTFSPDKRYIAAGLWDFMVRLLDARTWEEVKVFAGHERFVDTLSFSPDGKYILSGSDDSIARVWNIETGEWTALSSGPEGTEWIMFNSQGYWDSSNNGGDLVAMTERNSCWNIDQFAIKYNRPDFVSLTLPFTDEKTVNHYYRQYQRRLKRAGFIDSSGNPDESLLFKDNHVPSSEIISSGISGKFATVKCRFTDSELNLRQYNIYVNDVPIFGAYGKPLSGESHEISEKIELTAGINKIELSCMNEKGAESYRVSVVEEYKPAGKPKGDLYYIGFGVSKYKDPAVNELRFAHKDALDLAASYKKMKGKYANVYAHTFVNDECTVENIKKAKSLLKNSKPDDTLVLFIAGHGVHDTDKDATYYFVTHEAELSNLSGTAATFDSIEDILQGVAPRKKLFLMDTCESGEIEDSRYEELVKIEGAPGLIPRSIEKGRDLKIKGKQGKKNEKRTYLYSRDRYIYNDLVRRSGSVVFSSCRGSELSYESDEIKNGFFSYNIMKSMNNKTADKNRDGIISTDELREYVAVEVPKMSKGRQNLIVDRDNIYQKFGFPLLR